MTLFTGGAGFISLEFARQLIRTPRETSEAGLRHTARWYRDNPGLSSRVRPGSYRGERLGLGTEAGVAR